MKATMLWHAFVKEMREGTRLFWAPLVVGWSYFFPRRGGYVTSNGPVRFTHACCLVDPAESQRAYERYREILPMQPRADCSWCRSPVYRVHPTGGWQVAACPLHGASAGDLSSGAAAARRALKAAPAAEPPSIADHPLTPPFRSERDGFGGDVVDAANFCVAECNYLAHAEQLVAALNRPATPSAGFVIGNGDRTKWRHIADYGFAGWTDNLDDALQFVRRRDAEAFAAEDEDACCILTVGEVMGASSAKLGGGK